MSGRGRPRKVRDENPGASVAKSPLAPRKKSSIRNEEQVDKKSTDAKAKCSSKPQESPEVRPRKSPGDVKSTEETRTTKTAKSGEKKTPPICSVRRGSSIDENPSQVLQAALAKLKVKKSQRSESAKCVNDIQNKVTEYLKRHLDWCRDISVLKTGSYYENVKVSDLVDI